MGYWKIIFEIFSRWGGCRSIFHSKLCFGKIWNWNLKTSASVHCVASRLEFFLIRAWISRYCFPSCSTSLRIWCFFFPFWSELFLEFFCFSSSFEADDNVFRNFSQISGKVIILCEMELVCYWIELLCLFPGILARGRRGSSIAIMLTWWDPKVWTSLSSCCSMIIIRESLVGRPWIVVSLVSFNFLLVLTSIPSKLPIFVRLGTEKKIF